MALLDKPAIVGSHAMDRDRSPGPHVTRGKGGTVTLPPSGSESVTL
jgi:hypothetical protein